MRIRDGLPDNLLEKYEFYDYGHAFEILNSTYSQEWSEVKLCLNEFEITRSDIEASGGNKSPYSEKV